MTSFHFPHQRCRSTLMIAYEKFVGIYVETISSTTVTNYLDELCWGSTISGRRVIMEHKPAAWTMGFNIDFWAAVSRGLFYS